MGQNATTDQRVLFDFAVEFSNGGGIQGQEFRLDIDGESIDDTELADYIVRDMRLLMVKQVHILKKQIIAAPHQRGASPRRMLIDVSHAVEDGMITYKGLPAPIICDYLSREASRRLYAEGTEFQIGKIEMVANSGTYLDSPFHRFADGKDLAALDLAALADLECVVVRVDRAQRARDHAGRICRAGATRQGGTGAYRMGSALAQRPVLRRPPIPNRRRSAAAGGRGRHTGRDQLLQYR